MASNKRNRQRSNKNLHPSGIELTSRQDREISAVADSLTPSLVGKTAWGIVALAFSYNLAAKYSTIINPNDPEIPNFRNILPEPWDAVDHVGNIFWTGVLGHIASIRDDGSRTLAVFNKIPGIRKLNRRNYPIDVAADIMFPEHETPSAKKHITAAAIGAATVNSLIEVGSLSPDPIDILWGTATGAVMTTYQAIKTNRSLDSAH